jgi:hypothetical protein
MAKLVELGEDNSSQRAFMATLLYRENRQVARSTHGYVTVRAGRYPLVGVASSLLSVSLGKEQRKTGGSLQTGTCGNAAFGLVHLYAEQTYSSQA